LAKFEWSNKQKRAFHKVKSGVTIANLTNKPIQHIVLTTSPAAAQKDIIKDYQVLRKRIKRKWNIDIPYFCVKTNEGNGVLHIVARNDIFIPQRWLSVQWSQIHHSSYVYIKRPPKHVANYIITQYVSNQRSAYVRSSCSFNWVCKGFVAIWNDIKKDCRNYDTATWNGWAWRYDIDYAQALNRWQHFLENISRQPSYDYWQVHPNLIQTTFRV
jgi:hypothetical protein